MDADCLVGGSVWVDTCWWTGVGGCWLDRWWIGMGGC